MSRRLYHKALPQTHTPTPCRRFTTTPARPHALHPPPHTSLTSFLSYAARTNLPPSSTTYIGTHYEYVVLRALLRLGLRLRRVGGRNDAGIDLLGTWALPHTAPLRVLVQCKALSRAAGPNYIRELEGAFAGAPRAWRAGLALLVATKGATRGVREALGRSRLPLAYFAVGEGGVVRQVLWNASAGACGLEGVGVGVRYCLEGGGAADADAAGPREEIVLSWRGEVLPDHEADGEEEEEGPEELFD
ncbi:MAG: hypothetical protein M1829_005570 [Trizodia sp. TS-e1964]|nr:MAG: hypothetical protein M1829_005570 [Trizodia sp. TS-e1964]